MQLDPYIRKAKIVNCIDGDTVDAVIDLGFHLTTKQRIRFLGVDTPERNQEGYKEASAFTKEMLLGKEVIIRSEKSDVFGRYLATIFLEGRDFNQVLLDEGYAKVYVRK